MTPPAPSAAAVQLFGERLPLAVCYVGLLADSGVRHGLIGPREVPRLWDRHVVNCAVVAEAIPAGATVVDVGSGAGLPGLALAIARPDLTVLLVEPLLRRSAWLTSTVAELRLGSVQVRRARAEDLAGELSGTVVTARAVAGLARLAAWCLPLVAPGGAVLALKGESAAAEVERDRLALRRLGVGECVVEQYGASLVQPPTTVVRLVPAQRSQPVPARRRRGSRRR